ncbi:EamA family transporter RarD [Embleya sp. NPDC001921]
MSESRRGYRQGIAAYTMWGLFPLYWPLLEPAGAVEILAHRVVWSLVFVTVLLAVSRQGRWFRELLCEPVKLLKITAATLAISVNWAVYIHAVNNDQVVEASLGYFINPLLLIAAGVVVLNERLRLVQWIAVGLALIAVPVLVVEHGRPPWIALTLAATFAFYSYVKKAVPLPATQSFAIETALMLLPSAGFLAWLAWRKESTFTVHDPGHVLLFVAGGVVTAMPLLCFAAAATRLPMSTVGMLQYIEPVIQFLLGVLLFHEPMSGGRWAGFAMVWTALTLLVWDAARRRKSRPATSVAQAPTLFGDGTPGVRQRDDRHPARS